MSGDLDVGEVMRRVRAVIDDPPAVHIMDRSSHPPLGLWATDRDCYEFLAQATAARSTSEAPRTLETGCGLSTVVFAVAGAEHTCVGPSGDERDRLLAYAAARDIEMGAVEFVLETSDRALPRLAAGGELDVVFIDGNHGFPTPILDWYYGAGRLRREGLLVVDDIQLPAVSHLRYVVDRDPRWRSVHRSAKWCAWSRVDEGGLLQEWFSQPWLAPPLPTDPVALARRAVARARRTLGAARGR